MPKDKLSQLKIISFESRHAKTLADLIRAQGGEPFSAPALKEVPLENNPAAFAFAEKLFRNEIEVLILLTGVGTRTLVGVLEMRYPREKILEALRKIPIVPRGPKPIRVLNEFGVPYALAVPEPNTWEDLLRVLDENKNTVPIRGTLVAVQEYGEENPDLLKGLEERGAKVFRVPVYRWALPDDTTPLKEGIKRIVEGRVDAAVFTTAIQISHVFEVARQIHLEGPLKKGFSKMVVASVGPDCTKSIQAKGLLVDIEPESPKMGPLILALAERARQILEKKSK